MMSVWLILAAIVLLALSGLPACLLSRHSALGQRMAAALMVVGGVLGLCGIGFSLGEETAPALNASWLLPWGQFAVEIDTLSAIFLGPVFLVPALGSIYGLGYWKQSEHPENGRWLGFFYGLLAGALALVAIARDGVLFLMAWEVMALSAYFALVTEGEKAEVRRVGWIYLVATHVCTLSLFAMFSLWRQATGSFDLEQARITDAGLANAVFLLAFFAFAFKAGLFPLHFWLPGAHANAPSHVSAVLSGVMLKSGIYGLVRMSSLLPDPPAWWGGSMLAVGALTGVLGIAFALSQQDIKRLLAYSSVENMGIVTMGLGLALLGRSLGRPDWVLLGLGGALLHVWNHSLFKSLLFLNAGAILHAAHTREMDQLGGLARRMPKTAALFAVGAIAICGLPPLNGFVSEWLLYLGLFGTLGNEAAVSVPEAAVGAVALAAIGALAIACFIKVLGATFLGLPRSEAAHDAHDPGTAMIAPMTVLAAGCLLIGLGSSLVVPLLERAAGTWSAEPIPEDVSLASLAPLGWVGALGAALLALAGVIVLGVQLTLRPRTVDRAGTWDCGYAQPTARMQYTGSSFTQALVGLLGWAIRPRQSGTVISGLFARAGRFAMEAPDLVLDRGLTPAAEGVVRLLPWARRFQQGNVRAYLFYMLLMVVFLYLLGS